VTVKKELTLDGVVYDSAEEVHFAYWLKLLVEVGLVVKYTYQPKSFQLSEKQSILNPQILSTKKKDIHRATKIVREHNYTADWDIVFAERFYTIFPGLFLCNDESVLVDIKGTFGRNNDTRVFSINQKWVLKEYGLYVNKVIPEELFLKTFVPDQIAFRVKPRKDGALLRIKRYEQCELFSAIKEKLEEKRQSIKTTINPEKG
jgi:hypothetical protein